MELGNQSESVKLAQRQRIAVENCRAKEWALEACQCVMVFKKRAVPTGNIKCELDTSESLKGF